MTTTSVAENTLKRGYRLVSDEDLDWIETQKPCVQQLWIECMKAEKYGDGFQPLDSKLSRNAFSEARKELDGFLFEFEPIQRLSKSGQRKLAGWKVKNLHGSKVKEYWQIPKIATEKVALDCDKPAPNSCKPAHDLCNLQPETLTGTAVDSLPIVYQDVSNNLTNNNEDSSSISRFGCSNLEP